MTTSNDGGGDHRVFWGEIAPGEHMVQIYDRNEALVDALDGFISGGLKSGEAVVIIATPSNLAALEVRLAAHGFELDEARARNQYIALDAEETLAKFMTNGWPDDALFNRLVRDLIVRARGLGRPVRAFGEMVAVLWSRGDCAATVRLEHLWNSLCKEHDFSLFCAYPKIGFTQDAHASLAEICAAHTRSFSH